MKKPSLLGFKHKRLLIAGIMGYFIYLFSSITDNIFAGQFCGEEALAAVEVVVPFYSFIAFIGTLVSAGCGIKFSHLVGAGKQKESHQLFGLALAISVLFGVVTALLMFIFKDNFLSIFIDRTEEALVWQHASGYYDWFIAVAIIYPIYMLVYRIACEDGETVFSVAADAGEMIVNMVLSITLVQSPLGTKGLGMGTFFSILTATIIISIHFFRKSSSVKLNFKFRMKDIKDMLYFGAGSSLTCFFVAALDIVMNFYITQKFGVTYLIPYGMINFAINFTELFMAAVMSATPFISLGIGSHNKEDIRFGIKTGIKHANLFCLACTVVVGGLCTVIPQAYGIPKEFAYFDYCWISVLGLALNYLIYGNSIMLLEFYSASGKPIYSCIYNILQGFGLPLVLTLILGSTSLGYLGLMIAFFATPLIAYIVVLVMVKIRYKSKHLYIYNSYDEHQFSYDEYLTPESIISIRDAASEKLKEYEVEEITITKVMGLIEDTLMSIYNENCKRGNNNVLDRLTVCVGEDKIRLLNKNNGEIFDMVEYHKKKSAKSNYLYLAALSKKSKFNYGLMLSFNATSLEVQR